MTEYKFPAEFYETLKLWQSQNFETILSDYYDLLKENPALNVILNASSSLTVIMDMRTSAYVYVSNNSLNILGYPAEEIKEKGLKFALSQIHPEDISIYLNVTKNIWEFLLSIPSSQRKQYKTSVDFRIRNKSGAYIRVIQQNTALKTDTLGNITLLLMMITDISHLKKSNEMTAAIISTENDGYLVWNASDTLLKSQVAFSKREREIIRLLAEGFSTRQIAEKLSLSEYTVNTHRRNMLEKTKLQNARALVKFAMSHGMI
jgi:DNA-binding CsgD family transcriptional regulator